MGQNHPEWKCPACGWVHAEISEERARETVERAAQSAARTGEDPQITMDTFTTCFNCDAPAASFVPVKLGDAPRLATLQPVVIPATLRRPS